MKSFRSKLRTEHAAYKQLESVPATPSPSVYEFDSSHLPGQPVNDRGTSTSLGRSRTQDAGSKPRARVFAKATRDNFDSSKQPCNAIDGPAPANHARKLRKSPLESAILNADVQECLSLLQTGTDVNGLFNAPMFVGLCTPLFLACYTGEVAVTSLLLEHGANIDDCRSTEGRAWGLTALHAAVQQDHLPVAKLLLSRKANPNTDGTPFGPPIHSAVSENKELMVRILLEHGANVLTYDTTRVTPLHVASREGNATIIDMLIVHGADANAPDSLLETPLHWAVKYQRESGVDLLISHGADINKRNYSKLTPLHYAAALDKAAIVQKLLELGAEPNARDARGETPLHKAATSKRTEHLQLLLEHGADPTVKRKISLRTRDRTPLQISAKRCDTILES